MVRVSVWKGNAVKKHLKTSNPLCPSPPTKKKKKFKKVKSKRAELLWVGCPPGGGSAALQHVWRSQFCTGARSLRCGHAAYRDRGSPFTPLSCRLGLSVMFFKFLVFKCHGERRAEGLGGGSGGGCSAWGARNALPECALRAARSSPHCPGPVRFQGTRQHLALGHGNANTLYAYVCISACALLRWAVYVSRYTQHYANTAPRTPVRDTCSSVPPGFI